MKLVVIGTGLLAFFLSGCGRPNVTWPKDPAFGPGRTGETGTRTSIPAGGGAEGGSVEDQDFPIEITWDKALQDYDRELLKAFDATGVEMAELRSSTFSKSKSCEKIGNQIKSKPEIRIRFAIGYEDFAPDDLVSDLLERERLQEFLIRPCPAGVELCGFGLRSKDSFQSVLEKKREVREGKTQLVTVTISTSSIGTSNRSNLTNPMQATKSKRATSSFIQAFEEDDVVMYWGHGRDGGGPDFTPPLVDSRGHVTYGRYRQIQRGYGMVTTGLGGRYSRAQMVGLFGCNTMTASAGVRAKFSSVSFVTSNRSIGIEDVVPGSVGLAEAYLAGDCRSRYFQFVSADPNYPGPTYTTSGPFFKDDRKF